MTIFITAALPRRRSTERLIDALNMNAGIIGFSLLITAILQTIQKRLDLFHAIFVTFVTYYLALIGLQMDAQAHPAWGCRSNHDCCGVLSWSIYVTASVTTFGSTPQCNSRVKYVFFFLDHSISATTPWWRKFWIISLCVGATCVIVGIVAAIFVIRWATRKGVRVGDLLLETYSPRASKVLSIILFWIAGSATVMLELFIAQNKHLLLPGETEWAFGQVLSFVMLFVSLNEMFKILAHRIGC
ncbi:hypothetical protein BGW80DRAFT_1562916 [Lactifluus volemus]|nr:hypothetical protein BGW80DRAFT_1562916 [Lactifluus volemus]